jgi:hypothetical protein
MATVVGTPSQTIASRATIMRSMAASRVGPRAMTLQIRLS